MARSPLPPRPPQWPGARLGLGLALFLGVSSPPLLAQPVAQPVAQPWSINANPPDLQLASITNLARQTTVRLLTNGASGSGVIIQRQGSIYTVLTGWHVVAFNDRHTLLTPDGRRYGLLRSPRQLGNTDLAIVQFASSIPYRTAPLKTDPIYIGETVYAAGFPMYQGQSLNPTFDQGIQNLRMSQGVVSLLPTKSLAQGYRLGYSNDVVIGMSGGPIFNSQGLLVGINGRRKHRDPGFGVYAFEDGSEPDPALLEQMLNASWGIPISTYLQFFPAMSRRGASQSWQFPPHPPTPSPSRDEGEPVKVPLPQREPVKVPLPLWERDLG
ncbi:S1 family peptidase [Trichothermofontia sp.]